MRLVFAGTPATALPALEAVAESRHELAAVVTRPDAPVGRGRRLTASPVAERAAALGVEVLKPERPRDPDFLDRLAKIAPRCCPVVAYGALLPKAALAIPPDGWVNLHFSLLPAWRGAAPVQHAVLAGDEVTGASTFQIEQALDSGPVYGTITEPIGPRDTSGDLLARLSISGAKLLVATLDGIEDGSLQPVAQPAEGISLAPKLEAADAQVDFAAPALRVDRLVRACTPAPGAWTTFRGERLKLFPVRVAGQDEAAPDGAELTPGQLAVGKAGVWVGTGGGQVRLGQVQPHGKRPMPAADWARGVRPEPGERLG